jgi:vacuolar-type H+-ATPase subunit F/Vma7
MGKLIVVTTCELEPGYRLAGVATRVTDSAYEASAILAAILDAGAEGDVIAVHEPFFDAFSAHLRRRMDSLVSPLVVALPGGDESEAEGERRARLLRTLWQAVGFEITFDQQGETT